MRSLRLALGLLLFWLPATLLRWLLMSTRGNRRAVVRMRVAGALETEPGARRGLGPARSVNLLEILDRLKAVGRDPSVQAIAVRIGPLSGGWAEIDEIRQAILALRSRGRRAFAYLENPGHAEYFLATAFEHVVMPPMASLDVVGLRSEVTFFKGTLDLLGVSAQFEAAGEYKSFAEPFTRESMSEAFRESLDYVLADIHQRFVTAVASSRGLEPSAAQDLVDRGPWMAREARDAGLIDRTLYPDRWKRAVLKELGESVTGSDDDDAIDDAADQGPFARRSRVRFRAVGYLRPWRWLRSLERLARPGPAVAVVLATGTIGSGDEQEVPPGMIAWRALGRTLRAVSADPSVRAVVLRIDSPGGSGTASDLLWRELRRLRTKKPLVASMGSVAASGGYYLAMAADRIVADPLTITGSIGVVAGKFDVGGLLAKVGLKREALSYGRNTGLFSPTVGLSESERSRLREHLALFYEEFVGKGAARRGVDPEAFEQHCRGRIWTGSQAVDRGLVDEIGTLAHAVAEAQHRGGLDPSSPVRIYTAPRPGLLRRVRAMLPFGGARSAVAAVLEDASGWRRDDDLVQARMPYDVSFE